MNIPNLIIEVTRKCNMACPHCLRGDAEKISFDYKMLPNVFSGIDYIDTITFTGGEITVALPTFEKIVEYICTRNIKFGNFYIKTNLKKVSKKFLLLVDMLYQKQNLMIYLIWIFHLIFIMILMNLLTTIGDTKIFKRNFV